MDADVLEQYMAEKITDLTKLVAIKQFLDLLDEEALSRNDVVVDRLTFRETVDGNTIEAYYDGENDCWRIA